MMREQIEMAARAGVRIDKYNDPIEEAREGLTLEEALDVYAQDPALLHIDLTAYGRSASTLEVERLGLVLESKGVSEEHAALLIDDAQAVDSYDALTDCILHMLADDADRLASYCEDLRRSGGAS